MLYCVVDVNRKEYLESISEIADEKSRGFADMALRWWDRHYSWNAHGSVILTDEAGRHLCYLFYKIDRYGEYLTIHNLLTPLCHRRRGYAHLLLEWVFEQALQNHVKRFKAICVPQSLDFYLSLGFCYWGLTATHDYYCNLPLPLSGLNGVKAMVDAGSVKTLGGTALAAIYEKVDLNDVGLDTLQQGIHDKGLKKLQSAYMQKALTACMAKEKEQ